MDNLEERALFIRRELVVREHLLSIEGLAAIVAPTPDLRRASLMAAREAIEKEREEHAKRQAAPPVRLQRDVRLLDLLVA